MMRRPGPGVLLAAVVAALCLSGPAPGGPASLDLDQEVLPPPEKMVAVPADSGWVDTGIDAGPGDELQFSASGEISLQRGNPEAVCGPSGLDLITVEQPVPNANLGALIGKLVQPVARRTDEDSGLEIRDDIFILFLIGSENTVPVSFKGRLFLGINENVVRDNGGEYTVIVIRRPA
jgi:hypothetical protein